MSVIKSEMSEARRRGFNYGVGWGASPKPPAYITGLLLARLLGKKASLASQAAWAHEMLVRNVRLAETNDEKSTATELLHAANERIFADML